MMWNLKYVCAIHFFLIIHNNSAHARPRFEDNNDDISKCGYNACHPLKDGAINVHIVPHTHDDVGWLKTVDQYYYGSNTDIQKAGVQYILDSVIDALKKDADRRFIYVETAFFWKWWIKQHDFVKSQVRKLVNNGQLEFIGGAWSMNDEATTHYHSIIDQFAWGLRKLNETFGECGRPKVGWQIDPFGHSREQASLFAQLGFDGLFLGRIDFEDKAFRFKTRTPEMIWQGSANLGKKADLFTSVMFNTYSPPPGFCFDILCDDPPIIDDKKSPDYNVDKKVRDFLEYVKEMVSTYDTNNVLITMGDDFNYQDANMWFKNLDKLLKYVNQQTNETNVHVVYSTPSCYLKGVHDNAITRNISFPTKSDDFFPYASDPTAYWTGYFTSKPAIKRYERIGNNYLQVCKQLYALADLGPEDWVDLNAMREAMGVLQHHDAVTGTEKEHVAQDYARILSKGFDECDIITTAALNKLISLKKQRQPRGGDFKEPKPEIQFETCMLSNISQCAMTEKEKEFIVTVYNPLSRVVDHFVRFPVTANGVDVQDGDGQSVPVQIIPVHQSVLKVPGRGSDAKYEAVFKAGSVPGLGFKSYYAKIIEVDMITRPLKTLTASKHLITNGNIQIKLNDTTGKISQITFNGKDVPFDNDFFYYESSAGDNTKYAQRSSGAYIFRANGSLHGVADVVHNTVYQGAIVTEVHQTFTDWISQVVRVYNGVDHVEFEWLIGPIPVNDRNGKEVVTKYMTQLQSENTFYTDSNGREMLKRVKDFRPTWKLNLSEPIPGNYYPVTSKILIRDPTNDLEMAVLTDRAEGGSSLDDGHIELMLHRRCLHDDAFGVDEPLNETQFGKGLVVRGIHYVAIGSYIHEEGLAAYERDLAQRKLLQAWTFFSSTMQLSFADYQNKYAMNYSGLTENLPKNVQILTLEPWHARTLLLRLEHVLEKDEDSNLSQPVKVSLKNAFTPFKIVSIKETTLGANQWLENNNRLKFEMRINTKAEDFVDFHTSYLPTTEEKESNWKRGNKLYTRNQRESNDIKVPNKKYSIFEYSIYDDIEDEFDIILNPMEIRTFIIETDLD